jgi:hypothetical protein
MPLESVPSYLIEGVRITDPDRLREALDTDDETRASSDLEVAGQILGVWAGDNEFWGDTAERLPRAPPATTLDDILEEEQEVLAGALGGDRRLAELILLEAPLRSGRPNAQGARQVVVILRDQCREIASEPPTRKRRWRTLRALRRVFKAVGGGVLIAADIVAPDPTQIVRVASIWGGADMIIDAVRPD